MAIVPRGASDDGTRATYRRRTVLRGTALAIGTAVGGGVGAAQTEETPENRVTTMSVTPEQEDVAGDMVGMWIHLGPETDPIQASIADECDIVDWGDEDTIAYDVQLIDRAAEPQERSITLYLPRRVEVGQGDLFIVNDEVPCESGYVGLELEQIGARNIDVGLDGGATTVDDGDGGGGAPAPSDGIGPGFGPLAAAGGLLGAGWLFGRGDDEE